MEEVVLESRGSQYGGQLRKSKFVQILKLTLMPSGAPQLAAPSQPLLLAGEASLPVDTFPFFLTSVILSPNQAPRAYLTT